MTVKVGSILKDNDPRQIKDGIHRTVEVIALDLRLGYAIYDSGKRKSRIKLSRIWLDGKDRHQGFNFVA